MPAVDPFDIPKANWPEYMTYQWVRKSLQGQEDIENIKRAKAAGFRLVPRARLAHLPAAKRWDQGVEWSEYGGLVLMERPDYMTLQAQAELRRKTYELGNIYNAPSADIEIPEPEKPGIWDRFVSLFNKKKAKT